MNIQFWLKDMNKYLMEPTKLQFIYIIRKLQKMDFTMKQRKKQRIYFSKVLWKQLQLKFSNYRMKHTKFRIKPLVSNLRESGISEENGASRLKTLQKSSLNDDLKELLQQVQALIQQSLSGQQANESSHNNLEHRDRLITSLIKANDGDSYDDSYVEKWIGEVCRDVASTTFHYYIEEEMTFEQAKVFCCQQILRNISLFAEKHNIDAKFYVIVDKIMKEKVMPYLALKYPLSESLNVNKTLYRLVKQINNIEVLNNDFFFNNPNITLEYRQNGNYSDIIMKVLNQIISIADSHNSEGISNFKDFDNYISDMFQQVFDPVWVNQNGWLGSNGRLPSVEGKKRGRVSGFLKDMKDLKGVQQLEKYREKVQEYTHYQIGRKIPQNIHIYSQDQIKSGHLQVKSPQILRIMTKWCEQLWQKYQNENYYIDRSQGIAMINSTQVNIVYQWFKLQLKASLREQKEKVIKFMSNVENNLYQQEFKIFQSQLQSQEAPFINRYERVCGKFSIKVVNNLKNSVIIYLNRLIHGLMSISKTLFNGRMKGMPSWPSPPNLLSFKIGDLLRCRISSQEKQIIRLYDELHQISDTNPEKLKIIRVKNRLKSGTNDLLINVRYDNNFLAQIQLKVKSKVQGSRFAECSYQFSHFIYEIYRSYFGPISEMCSIWNNLDPRNKIYRDLVENQNLKVKGSEYFCTSLGISHNIQIVSNTPFICSNCGKSFSSDNYLLPHKKCKKCKYFNCTFCQIKQRQNTDLIEDLDIEDNLKKQIENQRCKVVPKEGVSVKIQNNAEGRVHTFTVVPILQKSYVFYLKSDNSYELAYELKTEKNKNDFLKENIVYELRHSVIEPQKRLTIKQAVTDFIMPQYVDNCYRLEKEAISLNKISNITCQTQKLQKMLKDSKDSKKGVKQLQISSQSLQTLDLIPEEMSNLEFINVNLNNITDISSLNKFKKLNTIYCLSNKLKNFPTQLCQLPLRTLSFGQNNIVELPPQFEQLQSLQTIVMKQNNMIVFPEVLTKLTNIKQINAESNRFEGLPETISKCTKLMNLKINSNSIVSLPHSFEQLQSLETLDLSRNRLNEFNFEFKKLKKLKELNLQRNKFSKIPPNLNECNSLMKLRFVQNEITVASFENISLEGLKELSLANNKMTEISHLQFIKGVTNLNLSVNKFQELTTHISELKLLQTLFLTNNSLTTLPESLSQCANLKYLQLTNNKSLALPITFSKLKLESLIFEKCSLTQFDPKIFALKKLKHLIISNNAIEKIPEEIEQLKYLQIFQVENNKITAFPDCLKNLKNLKKLTFKQTVACEPGIVTQINFNLPLTVLNISASRIESLPEVIPSNLSLEKLDLGRNQLVTIPSSISNLSFLKELILSLNKLNSIPEQLFQLKELRTLMINNNNLKELPNSFNQFTKLTKLDISSNYLTEIPNSIEQIYSSSLNFKYQNNPYPFTPFWIFAKDITSTDIDLSNLKLETLPDFSYRNAYKKVKASQNELKEFPTSIINLTKLTELNLQSNQIKIIPAQIRDLKLLVSLNLSDNMIQQLPGEMGELTKLIFFNIAKNPLKVIQEGFSKLTTVQLIISPDTFPSLHSNNCLQYIKANELQLQQLELTQVPPQIGEISSVKILNLSTNKLTAYPDQISQLESLQKLILSDQPLKNIPSSLGNLKNLIKLELLKCELTQLPASIGNLQNLQTLNIGQNKIAILPQSMKSMKNLIYFQAERNELKQISAIFMELPKLKGINLDYNKIREIPDWVSEMAVEIKLNLTYNQIDHITQVIKKRIISVRNITIEGNAAHAQLSKQ